MKRYYTIINYLLCSICLLWMTGCSGILDDMRPKDQIPQDMLSESDLEKLLNGVYAEMEELVFKFYMDRWLRKIVAINVNDIFTPGGCQARIACRWQTFVFIMADNPYPGFQPGIL